MSFFFFFFLWSNQGMIMLSTYASRIYWSLSDYYNIEKTTYPPSGEPSASSCPGKLSLRYWAFAWLNDCANGDEADFTFVQTHTKKRKVSNITCITCTSFILNKSQFCVCPSVCHALLRNKSQSPGERSSGLETFRMFRATSSRSIWKVEVPGVSYETRYLQGSFVLWFASKMTCLFGQY